MFKKTNSIDSINVFLDSCCWISACKSKTGGSALLLQRGIEGYINIYTSDFVQVVEVQKHISLEERNILDSYIDKVQPIFVSYSSDLHSEFSHIITDRNDVPILAAARSANVDVIVSLDKKHLLTEKIKNEFPIPVLGTTEFFLQYPELQSNRCIVNK